MVTVMDMESGRLLEGEFGPFMDQVLDANWLPRPEVATALQALLPTPALPNAAALDAEAFLRNVYLCQE
jgi:hypothetical protein